MSAYAGTKVRRPAAEVAAILAAFEGSGLSQRAFCSQRDLSVNTLNGWLRQRRAVESGRAASGLPAPGRLIPVRLSAAEPVRQGDESPILEIVLKNKRSIRVLHAASPDQLRMLLDAVEAL